MASSSTVVTYSPQSQSAAVQQPSQSPAVQQASQPRSVEQVKQNDVTRTPLAPSPGRFQHPRVAEILKRRSRNDFNLNSIYAVFTNAFALAFTFWGIGFFQQLSVDGTVSKNQLTMDSLERIDSWSGVQIATYINPTHPIWAIRAILVTNIVLACQPILPYFNKPDTIEDIPLTPSQRALLGLPRSQSNTPVGTAGTAKYITPPRYRRSSPSYTGTPQSNTTNRATYTDSPASTSRHTLGFSPSQNTFGTPTRRASGSPFSGASPLFSKAVMNQKGNSDWTESTRSLLGGNVSTNSFNSTLRRSQSLRDRRQEPGTPSPITREKTRVNIQPGLNYKWLYDKGLKVGKNGAVEYDR